MELGLVLLTLSKPLGAAPVVVVVVIIVVYAVTPMLPCALANMYIHLHYLVLIYSQELDASSLVSDMSRIRYHFVLVSDTWGSFDLAY